jgi:Secretion system C-terminal sorting domain/Cohesin domain
MIRSLLVASFGLVFMFSAQFLAAQMTLNAPFISPVTTGSIISVPVRVKNFMNIEGMQFAVKWDPAVLKFQGVGNFNLPSLDQGVNFMLDSINFTKFRFNWYSGPQNLADFQHIFKINFKVIGAVGSFSDIIFSDDDPGMTSPFPIEIIQRVGIAGVSIPFILENGKVGVGFTIATDNLPKNDEKSAFSVSPNPFTNHFFVQSTKDISSENCQIELQNVAGRTVFQQNNTRIPAGGIEIATNGLANGIYFLIIRNSHFIDIKKLMLVE